jgi:hypothetical protein
MRAGNSTPKQSDRPTVLRLAGELDLGSLDGLELRLDEAFGLGRPILVDVGDCTFATVDVLHFLVRAARDARERGLGFVVVLPYSASSVLRRLVLELAPDLAEFRIAPSLRVGSALLARPVRSAAPARVDDVRLRELRAMVWENASRLEALLASRDVLLLEKRRTLEQVHARRGASA